MTGSSNGSVMTMTMTIMCVAVLVFAATALPPNATDLLAKVDGNVTIVKPTKSQLHVAPSSNRQARADFTSLARFITPDNLAQMKSLFSGLGNYGSSGLSNALSFNVGNLVIVTLLAGLALLIAPTILGLVGLGAVGTNLGRSLGITNEKGHMIDTERMYRTMDSFFQEYNIDAKTCLQRFSCAASRKSSSAVRGGNPSYVDSALNYFLESTYVTAVLDKTSMLSAVNYGKSGGDCEIEYGKCPFSWEKVSNYLPFNGFKLSSPFFGSGNDSSSTLKPASTEDSKLPQASITQ